MFPLELPQNGLSSTRGGWCHLDLIFRFLIREEEAALFSDKKSYIPEIGSSVKCPSPEKNKNKKNSPLNRPNNNNLEIKSHIHFHYPFSSKMGKHLVGNFSKRNHVHPELLIFTGHKNKLLSWLCSHPHCSTGLQGCRTQPGIGLQKSWLLSLNIIHPVTMSWQWLSRSTYSLTWSFLPAQDERRRKSSYVLLRIGVFGKVGLNQKEHWCALAISYIKWICEFEG